MNRLFGSSKVSKPTLNDTTAMLDSRLEVLNKQIAAVDQELIAYNKLPPSRKASQKSRALALLQRKKMYEKQRATIEGQSTTLATTTMAVENIQIQKSTYEALRGAQQQMKNNSKQLNINKVEDVMDDLHYQIEDQSEMDDLFSRPIGQNMYTTDADLESELAGLVDEDFGLESNANAYDFRAPSVPVHPIKENTVNQYGLSRLPATGMRN